MGEFANPYQEINHSKDAPDPKAVRLAKYLVMAFNLSVSDDERLAFAKVIHVIFREHPWIPNIAVLKKWLE